MSSPCHLHQLFPTCLYVADIEGSEQLNDALLPRIFQLREQDLGSTENMEMLSTFENEGWTSYFSRSGKGLINELWTNELQRVILEHTERFVDMLQLDFGKRQPHITTLFANVHEEMYHRHDVHTHPGSMFSGTYYVKSYPGAGRFRLVNPNRALQFHELSCLEETPLNINEVAIDCVAGRLAVFQSHVPHSVDRPTARGERIAIAFNVNYD